jgi:hypothetical protein
MGEWVLISEAPYLETSGMKQHKKDPVLPFALCRAARGYLGWPWEELAPHSLVSRSTIRDVEGQRQGMHRSTEAQLRLAFEKAGLRFGNADGFPGLSAVHPPFHEPGRA